MKQQTQEINKVSQELGPDKGKDWHVPPEAQPRLEAELQNVHCETPSEDIEESARAEAEKTPSETSENPQSTRVAVSSSQQSYIQYQHSYPYLHLCETNNTSFSVMSPALVHNYPGNVGWNSQSISFHFVFFSLRSNHSVYFLLARFPLPYVWEDT